MKRRSFLKKTTIISLFPYITTGLLARNTIEWRLSNKPFSLNFAPHFGMFKNHAGEDLIDQIQFMHDHGFRSLEDNGMKSRDVATQNKIASVTNEIRYDVARR